MASSPVLRNRYSTSTMGESPSVACSTPEALAWDPGPAVVTDPSGHAVRVQAI
jgi:hypothetical protein